MVVYICNGLFKYKTTMNHNPYLKPWQSVQSAATAGQGYIEKPTDCDNIVWQTRSAPPSDFESQLAHTLTTLFTEGAESLSDIVAGLNQAGVKTPAGQLWTEETFRTAIKHLGA